MDKNPPTNAGDMGSIPGPERLPRPRSNQARVVQLLVRVLQLLKPARPEATLHSKTRHHDGKPAHPN